MIRVGIIGAAGYTGGELMRLLATHPETDVVAATSRRFEGQNVTDIHKHLKGFYDLKFCAISNKDIAKMCDVVFLAVPHGTAMDFVPELLNEEKCKVVDLSADYRLPPHVFEQVYGLKHKDPRKGIVYGIPELCPHEKIAESQLISNPGCFPTGATLCSAPLASMGLIEAVIYDSKTGISGAGNKPSESSHFPNLTENIIPYKLTTHRHLAEMKQELAKFQPEIKNVFFTPHIIPATRGILTTAHIMMRDQLETKMLIRKYKDFYSNCPFVRIVQGIPSLSDVRGSNFCDISLEIDEETNRVVVISAIDNLVKGASGQAIQNMNIMFGLDETTGLYTPGLP